MSVRRAVIDACVALKWRLRDEEATAEADRLLGDYMSGTLDIIAPALIDYEVGNALRTASVRGRITESEAIAAFTDLGLLGFVRHSFETTRSDALGLSLQYNRSVYDAAYLALASTEGLILFTGDRRLHNAVAAHLPWVRWIGDYRLEDIPEVPVP